MKRQAPEKDDRVVGFYDGVDYSTLDVPQEMCRIPASEFPTYVRAKVREMWEAEFSGTSAPFSKEEALKACLTILDRLDKDDQHRVVDALVALGAG